VPTTSPQRAVSLGKVLTVEKALRTPAHCSTLQTSPLVAVGRSRLSRAPVLVPYKISICTSKVSENILEPITIIDFLKKVNSDFPYSTRRGRSSHQHQRKSYMTKNIIESLPEMVEEEKNEEEEVSARVV